MPPLGGKKRVHNWNVRAMKIQPQKAILLLGLLCLVACKPAPTSQAGPDNVQPTGLPSAMPADFQVSYAWEVGSLPPAHFYRYTINLGLAEAGQIEFQAGYAGEDAAVWVERFEIVEAELESLYTEIYAAGVFEQRLEQMEDIPMGGSADKLQVIAYGVAYQVPSYVAGEANEKALDAIYAKIENLVPPNVWDKLNAQHAEYVEAHE